MPDAPFLRGHFPLLLLNVRPEAAVLHPVNDPADYYDYYYYYYYY
jgi:hypothetical protein